MPPIAVVLVLIVLAVVTWFALPGRRTPSATRGSLGRRPPQPSRRWKRSAILLMVGAALFLALGFTQFRLNRQHTSPGTVLLAIDVSQSMSGTDVLPSRLEAAKTAAQAFLDKLPTELRVGLVTFAGSAELLVAPSLDQSAARLARGSLRQGQGTVIGDAISVALDAIQALRAQGSTGPAAVVLLSDGRDTGSLAPPERAAARAHTMGVKIYTVVIGQANTQSETGANVELMRQIAETTDGSTFTAATSERLIGIYQDLGSQLSTEVDVTDYGALFIGIAGMFAVAATVALLVSLRSDF